MVNLYPRHTFVLASFDGPQWQGLVLGLIRRQQASQSMGVYPVFYAVDPVLEFTKLRHERCPTAGGDNPDRVRGRIVQHWRPRVCCGLVSWAVHSGMGGSDYYGGVICEVGEIVGGGPQLWAFLFGP